MYSDAMGSDVALDLSHSSSINPSALTHQSVEIAQFLISGMSARQILVRGGADIYCSLCVQSPEYSTMSSLFADGGDAGLKNKVQ